MSAPVVDVDHNATTALDPRVREAMDRAPTHGNPSSTHALGRAARAVLDAARREAAVALGCEPGELVFTASGSEANALALCGTFGARRAISPRVLVSAVEHPSVRETAKVLCAQGASVVELPVDGEGVVQLPALQAELTRGAAVCAVMWANNETGAIQPVKDIFALTRAAGVPYLCDAVQAMGKAPLDGGVLAHADMVSVSAHKLHGPAGAGVLVVRRGASLPPLVGGHQERGRRGGTESVPLAVGTARALTLARREENGAVGALRDHFEAGLGDITGAQVNALGAPRLCNTSSVTFEGVDGEALLIALDLRGVCASLGAACASGALSPSHVLLAMGRSEACARSTLRFSFGRDNTAAEVDHVLGLLAELVPNARVR